jgi:hypothetical protein
VTASARNAHLIRVFGTRREATATLTFGDVLEVTKVDRLARSQRDLLNTRQAIAEKGAGFKVQRLTRLRFMEAPAERAGGVGRV